MWRNQVLPHRPSRSSMRTRSWRVGTPSTSNFTIMRAAPTNNSDPTTLAKLGPRIRIRSPPARPPPAVQQSNTLSPSTAARSCRPWRIRSLAAIRCPRYRTWPCTSSWGTRLHRAANRRWGRTAQMTKIERAHRGTKNLEALFSTKRSRCSAIRCLTKIRVIRLHNSND